MGDKAPTRKVYVPPAQQRILISPERLKTIRSIVCTGLPDSLRDKDAFKSHFKRYGKITRSVINSEKATATVYYQTHEMAAEAKKNGNRGYPDTFKIAWSQTLARRSSGSTSAASRHVMKAEKPKPSSSGMADPEVAEELRSMAEASAGDFLGQPRTQTRMDQFVNKRKPPDAPHTSQLRPSQLQVPKARASTPPTLQVPQPRTMRANTPPPRAVAAPSGTSTLALMEVLRKPAFSTEERLAVLEARDKLLRLRGVRGQQVAGLKAATVGTCEDMCPEKERYLREDRHQVSYYEQNKEGNLSHAFAVKQYSRSSADQELPLPHELRPPRVLRATMNHLLARIVPRIDRVGESVGDWFFFLWDRTRAIRKDITQQELCDLDAVTLVEQCARFHVACSARLAGYELSVFDPKINTENLTKCLQTLKHMYHDTELRGVSCPNEPEFRAYVALLNLNSGDAMREVQELHPEVRMSAPVRRAVQAYLALSNRNYVRFFRVVRSMGFLAASVLMRYFPQVRVQAMEMLIRALCPSHRGSIQFPLSELMRQLGFESCEDAADFCERCGLDTNAGIVALSRGAFQPPASMSALKRAPLLVESQLTTSLAEAIAGCTLEQISAPPPEPVSSFDPASGFLTAKARQFLDLTGQTAASTQFAAQAAASAMAQASAQAAALAQHNQQIQIHQMASGVAQKVFDEVTLSITHEVASASARDWRLAVASRTAANACLVPVIQEIVREVSQEVLAAAQMEERARQQALEAQRQRELRRQLRIDAIAKQILEGMLDTVVVEETREACEMKVLELKALTQRAGEMQKRLVQIITNQELRRIVEQELKEAKERRAAEIREVTHRLLMKRVHRVLLRWREKALRARRQWERITNFPPTVPSHLTSALQALELGSPLPEPRAYPRSKKLNAGPTHKSVPIQTQPLVDVQCVISQLTQHRGDIPSFLLPDTSCGPLAWNAAVSLPSASPRLHQWMKQCLETPLNNQGVHESREGVLVRLAVTSGPVSELHTPHAVALVVTTDEAEAAERLRVLLSGSSRESPAPVALLMAGGQAGRGLGPELGDALQELGQQGQLHHVRCFPFAYHHHQMEIALRWLASRSRGSRLVCAPLNLMVASLLRGCVWQSIVAAAVPPSQATTALIIFHRLPEACLRLVNSQLECLARELESAKISCSDCELQRLKDNCPAFSSKCLDSKYRAHGAKMLRELSVPMLQLDSCSDWPETNSALAGFCRQIAPSHAMDSLLSWVSQQVTTLHCATPQELPWSSLLESMFRETLASQELLDSSGQEFLVVLPNSQLSRLASTSLCCPPDVLEILTTSKKSAPPSPPPPLAPRKRKIEEKLDELLAGLAQCRARYQHLDIAGALVP